MQTNLQQLMAQKFGYLDFKPGQAEIIKSILEQHDTLGIMPTGGGKSLCYQLPSMVLPGLTLVISPLIALMKDQVDALLQQGIAASYINSSLTVGEQNYRLNKASRGDYKLLYVAPERLETGKFTSFFQQFPVSLLAIDEAHCVSQWGHDFRPSYLNIAPWIASLPCRPVIAAFTATATPQVQKDIIKSLSLEQPHIYINSFNRPNLYFTVLKGQDRLHYINRYLQKHPEQAGIIYAATRKEVENIYAYLQQKGYAAGKYHAGLKPEERSQFQEDFIYDRKPVIVATNAFGLGIDKSNVRFVIHHNMPRHLEAYYQEAGRAGRDGHAADCILLFQAGDIQIQKYLIENSNLTTKRKQMEYAKLKSMIGYCHTSHCLRQYIMQYFGEKFNPANCNNCSNCSEAVMQDLTIEAQKILSCVVRMKNPYGSRLIASVLKGSQQQRVLELGFDKLSTYGIMNEYSIGQIVELINRLAAEDYLLVSGGQYPVVSLGPHAWPVLRGQEKVILRLPPSPEPPQQDDALFQLLRTLRREIAQQEGVPPYVIFSDKTLQEMSQHLPADRSSMLEINGVGEVKMDRYGQKFLDLIGKYQGKDSIEDITTPQPPPKTPQGKKKTPTHLLSWQMYNNGQSIDEIASERSMVRTTIEEHLLRAAREGCILNWSDFVTLEEEQEILKAVQRVGAERLHLRPLKEILPDSISYFTIKAALTKNGL